MEKARVVIDLDKGILKEWERLYRKTGRKRTHVIRQAFIDDILRAKKMEKGKLTLDEMLRAIGFRIGTA